MLSSVINLKNFITGSPNIKKNKARFNLQLFAHLNFGFGSFSRTFSMVIHTNKFYMISNFYNITISSGRAMIYFIMSESRWYKSIVFHLFPRIWPFKPLKKNKHYTIYSLVQSLNCDFMACLPKFLLIILCS